MKICVNKSAILLGGKMELLEIIYPMCGQDCYAYFSLSEDMEKFLTDVKLYRQVKDEDIKINVVTIALRSRGKYNR